MQVRTFFACSQVSSVTSDETFFHLHVKVNESSLRSNLIVDISEEIDNHPPPCWMVVISRDKLPKAGGATYIHTLYT